MYEAPGKQTRWSNLTVYCRTGYAWTWEDLLHGNGCGPVKWIEETGENTFWLFRTRPGRVFVIISQYRFRDGMPSSGVLLCGKWMILPLPLFAEWAGKVDLTCFQNS